MLQAWSGSDRVLRGGSWVSDARDCRGAYRIYFSAGTSGSIYGFRLAAFRGRH
ncbi:MAG: SUMF1/EgtB/PvdO family nonheme iron enzyme [Desulfobacteraceae bacterium]|nr:SUMF1/EgtB/PvdO family nonheme iron enzyme [Desulfobacteraceae bacterium]